MARLTPGGSERDRDRALSTTVGYALNLGITALLLAGLLVGVGGHVADQRERAVDTELDRLGQHVGSKLLSADRLARTTDAYAAVDVDLPTRVAGQPYLIAVEDTASGADVVLSTDEPAATVRVEVGTHVPVEPADLAGGDLRIVYDGATLEVRADA